VTKIVVCYPGPSYSVFDTANYYAQAFEDIGCKVERFNYHNNLVYHDVALGFFAKNYTHKEHTYRDLYTLASNDLVSCIARFIPDIVVVVSGLAFPLELWDWLHEMQKSFKKPFKLVSLLTESPYIDDQQDTIAGQSDVVFTTERKSVDRFSGLVEAHYITHAYMPQVHHPYNDGPKSDVFIVGTGFPERIKAMESVDWSGIDLAIRGGWKEVTEGTPLWPYYEECIVPNEEAAKWYSNAKISLNIFRKSRDYIVDMDTEKIETDEAESLGPRVYEVLACGGFLLTDYRPELEDLFKGCYDLFDDDLDDKVRYWLAHERSKVVGRALEKVKPYTYQANATRVLEVLGYG